MTFVVETALEVGAWTPLRHAPHGGVERGLPAAGVVVASADDADADDDDDKRRSKRSKRN